MDLVLLGQIQDGEMEGRGRGGDQGDKIQQSLFEKLVEGPVQKKGA